MMIMPVLMLAIPGVGASDDDGGGGRCFSALGSTY